MPTTEMVPVGSLELPTDPMRITTLMKGIDGLCASLSARGQIQEIAVRDIGGGRYRIIAGHRRSVAATKMGWTTIRARVYREGEGDDEAIKAEENLHRTQVSDAEEAVMYRRLVDVDGLDSQAIHLRFNVPESRVTNLLSMTYGDPKVLEALGDEQISLAQAVEINKWETPTYRMLALDQAIHHGLKAEGIRRWRMDVKHQGGEQQVDDIIKSLHDIAPAEIAEPMQLCQIGNHPAPLRLSKHYVICGEHWDIFVRGLEDSAIRAKAEEMGLWRPLLAQVKMREAEEALGNGRGHD